MKMSGITTFNQTNNKKMNTSNLELRNIKINTAFSRETICFTADVYDKTDGKRGKKMCSVYNEGNGGCTFIAHDPNNAKYEWHRNYNAEQELTNWVDAELDKHMNQKEEQRFIREMERASKKMLVFCDANPPTKYISVGSPKVSIHEYSADSIVTTIKKYVAEGWILFNKNLDASIMEKAML